MKEQAIEVQGYAFHLGNHPGRPGWGRLTISKDGEGLGVPIRPEHLSEWMLYTGWLKEKFEQLKAFQRSRQ